MNTAEAKMKASSVEAAWPALPLAEWQDTCDTLHMWMQVVGKTQLALTPLTNHWWNVTLRVCPRGLRTPSLWSGDVTLEMEFDLIHHKLRIETSQGTDRDIALYPRSVADFYSEYMATLQSLGVDVKINTMPVEFADPIRFEQDQKHAAYDKEYVDRLRRILNRADRLFNEFRSRFIGKSSPVHFFWGSFDLAVTRFSGKRAPDRPGADRMTSEAYSHEVSSCGWWPGDGRFPQPAFYAYAAPAPTGFDKASAGFNAAFLADLGEFLLKYDDVRTSASADRDILDFCQKTYEATADLGGWDRAALERT
jgi:hypothetical protein